MSSTPIYSVDPSLDSLIEEYNNLNDGVVFGNRSRGQQCVALAKIKNALVEKHGSDQKKAYKKDAGTIVPALNITMMNFKKMSQIGRFVMSKNDESWYDKSLSDIQKEFRKSDPKQKTTRTKKEQPPAVDVEALYARIAELEKTVAALQAENAALKHENAALKHENERLQSRIEKLEENQKIFQDYRTIVKFFEEQIESNTDQSFSTFLKKHSLPAVH